MKYLLLLTIVLLASCGPSPLAIEMEKQKHNHKQKLIENDTLTIEDSVPVVPINHKEVVAKLDTNVGYPVAVKVTIIKVLDKQFTNLSNTAKDAIADNIIATNPQLISMINKDVDEVVSAKLKELEDLGLIVQVDARSPINVSNRYKYTQSSLGDDSLQRKQLSWEKKKKKN